MKTYYVAMLDSSYEDNFDKKFFTKNKAIAYGKALKLVFNHPIEITICAYEGGDILSYLYL